MEKPSLGKRLFSMTWPMVFGVLSLLSFQLIDSAFIGQLGVLPLAAQGFTLPVQMIIIGIEVGLGIATTAIISRAIGAGDMTYAKQLGGLILLMGGAGVAAFSVMIWALQAPILSLLSAPDSVYPIIASYWPVWLLSAWTGSMLYFLYSLCRANGNTMLPGVMMVVTSLLNLVLDPIFIFYLGLGIEGAAIATILAFGIGILIVAPRVGRQGWYSFEWQNLNVVDSLRSIGHIMGPAMISQLLPPLSSMLATKLLAGFGTAAVAAWAIGSRFELFAIVSVLALTMSMPPMIGGLLGEGKLDNIHRLVVIAARFIVASQLVIALITFVLATPLSAVMTSDSAVETILMTHLSVVPASLSMLGVCILMVSVCNALGKSYLALTLSALRLFVFFLPCLWLGAHLGEIQGLMIGAAIGNVLAGMSAWFTYRHAYRHAYRQLTTPSHS